MSAIPQAVRTTVIKRDAQCIRCGGPGAELHHRQRRRDAGHPVEGLIFVCRTCHTYIHANPDEARDNGWIVSAFIHHQEEVTLKTFYGWVKLNPDGKLTVAAWR